MDELVDTLIEDSRWSQLDLAGMAETAARAVLARLDLRADGYCISLLGCNDARIAVLNADFRGKAQPTNVLSWPATDLSAQRPGAAPRRPPPGRPAQPAELGDIAIAFETCRAEADAAGLSHHDHVLHLLVHGTLHLLGYDHIAEEDAALMEGIEVEILASMGVGNPYVLD